MTRNWSDRSMWRRELSQEASRKVSLRRRSFIEGLFMVGQGCWSTHAMVKRDNLAVLGQAHEIGVEPRQLANLLINPLTVYGMLSLCEGTIELPGHKAAIQTAAMSDVGKFMRKKCLERGFPMIHVVRREEQVEQIKAEGTDLVLNSEDPQFEIKLREMSHQLNATIAFESVAGELTGKVLNQMPDRSAIYLYGSLSLKMVGHINPVALIHKQKVLKGFHLLHSFLHDKKVSDFSDALIQDIKKNLIASNYQKEISMDQINDELAEYAGSLGKGKLLINLVS